MALQRAWRESSRHSGRVAVGLEKRRVHRPGQGTDALQAWVAEADVDGFNLSRTVMPECLESFIETVVPVLQERGVYKSAYAPGTYREKLFGQGPLLPTGHPAIAARGVAADGRDRAGPGAAPGD